jgi:hypothetical protein
MESMWYSIGTFKNALNGVLERQTIASPDIFLKMETIGRRGMVFSFGKLFLFFFWEVFKI